MRVLAFDTASVTGCAFGVAGGIPKTWSVGVTRFNHKNVGIDPWPVRFSKTLRMTAHYIDKFKPDLITVEAFVGGPKANTDLAGLVCCVLGEAERHGIQTVTYYPSTVRKYFLGEDNKKSKIPIKSRVYARCRMLGWDIDDLDAADAAALWDYTCSMHSKDHQMTTVGGLFR